MTYEEQEIQILIDRLSYEGTDALLSVLEDLLYLLKEKSSE